MKDSTNSLRHNRTALILYGSETGNSQDVAEELGRVAERLLFKTRVTEMDLVAIVRIMKISICSSPMLQYIHAYHIERVIKLRCRRFFNLYHRPGRVP